MCSIKKRNIINVVMVIMGQSVSNINNAENVFHSLVTAW